MGSLRWSLSALNESAISITEMFTRVDVPRLVRDNGRAEQTVGPVPVVAYGEASESGDRTDVAAPATVDAVGRQRRVGFDQLATVAPALNSNNVHFQLQISSEAVDA